MNKFRNYLALIIIVTAGNLTKLEAQVYCNGNLCNLIPSNYLGQLNGLGSAFQSQYMGPLTDSLTQAAILTNSNTGLIGRGHVNRFEGGVGLSGAVVQGGDINVMYGGMELPKMPNVGIGVSPFVMGAVNLGFLFGKGQSDQDERTFLHRFSLYGHGINKTINLDDYVKSNSSKSQMDGKLSVNSSGIMVRFQLIQESYTRLNMFGFTGLTVGVGYNEQNFHLDMSYREKKSPTVKFGLVSGTWAGNNLLEFDTKAMTVPVDVRTGFRFLYLFTVFAGAGTSFNNAEAQIHLSRVGPFTIQNPLELPTTAITNSVDPNAELLKYLNLPNPDKPDEILRYLGYPTIPSSSSNAANLGLEFRGYGRSRARVDYGILGMEINILTFKIVAEAMILKGNNKQGSIGVKFAL